MTNSYLVAAYREIATDNFFLKCDLIIFTNAASLAVTSFHSHIVYFLLVFKKPRLTPVRLTNTD